MTSKLSKAQRLYLKQLVVDCQLHRFSVTESLSFVKEKLGVGISESYFHTVKKNLNDQAADQLVELRKDKNVFLQQYSERINEAYWAQRELRQLYEKEVDSDRKVRVLKLFMDVSVQLLNITNLIPEIAHLQFASGDKDKQLQLEERISYEEDPEAKF